MPNTSRASQSAGCAVSPVFGTSCTVNLAETSILSVMGKTYPIQDVDDPNQAGEGILPEESEDPQVEEQKNLNSGLQYMAAARICRA